MAFITPKLKRLCNSSSRLRKKFGSEIAERVQALLILMDRANSLHSLVSSPYLHFTIIQLDEHSCYRIGRNDFGQIQFAAQNINQTYVKDISAVTILRVARTIQ